MIITSPKQIVTMCNELQEKKKEYIVGIYLDSRGGLLHKELISIGTVNGSLVHPREVFEPALRVLASQLVLVHNHPSGDPAPSEADKRITKRIKEAGELLGIVLADHIIIGKDMYRSFVEEKLL